MTTQAFDIGARVYCNDVGFHDAMNRSFAGPYYQAGDEGTVIHYRYYDGEEIVLVQWDINRRAHMHANSARGDIGPGCFYVKPRGIEYVMGMNHRKALEDAIKELTNA